MRPAALLVLVLGVPGCALYLEPESEPVPGDPVELPGPALGTASPWVTDGPGVLELAYGRDIMWIEQGGTDGAGALREIDVAGGAIRTRFTAAGRFNGLASGPHAYFTRTFDDGSGLGEVRAIGIGYQDDTDLVLDTLRAPGAITVSPSHVYYVEAVPGDAAIWRVPTQGGAPELVAAGLDDPWDLDADRDFAYFTERASGRVMRVAGDGSGEPEILAQGYARTTSLTRHFGRILFVGCAQLGCPTSTLYEVPAAGGLVEALLEVDGNSAGKIDVTQGGIVVWGRWKLDRDANPELLITDTTPETLPMGVLATGDVLYVADFYSGRIYRRDAFD